MIGDDARLVDDLGHGVSALVVAERLVKPVRSHTEHEGDEIGGSVVHLK